MRILVTGAAGYIGSGLARALAQEHHVIGTDQTGQLRYNGRKEQHAIDDLELDVIDPSDEQSTAAVLDKISGASLIRSRQQQAGRPRP